MKRTLLSVAVVVSSLTAYVFAAGLRAKPATFDPDNSGIISSAWVTKQGLPDAGNSNHALYLAKAGTTATNAAAVALIDGEEGQAFAELGFDVRNDGACGAGAPRLNVTASDGFHFCGCSGATSAPIAPNWTRKRFFGPECFPAITPGAILQSVNIVFDEGTDTPVDNAGATYIDNIDVNGVLIGKPGNAN